jgi:hypothetical protein
MSLFFSPLLLL